MVVRSGKAAGRRESERTRRALVVFALAVSAAGACAAPGRAALEAPPAAAVPPSATPVAASPAAQAEALRGILEDNLLVGFCGAPGTTALGEMTGNLDAAAAKLTKQAGLYRAAQSAKPTVPVVELIATTAHHTPGADGMYRSRADDTTIKEYLDHARKVKAQLLLNIQPGRADFLPEVKAYERWLKEPDVGVALDPEWAVDPGVVPGKKFGHTTGAELDGVAAYLGALATKEKLPAKVMAYHQVAASVVRDEAGLKPHPGVSALKIVDGIGTAGSKKATWNLLMKNKPAHVAAGFKLFFTEDSRKGAVLMTPAEVMALEPKPSYVVYE